MRMSELTAAEPGFRTRLRSGRTPVNALLWYPYSSLNNISILTRFLPADLEIVPTGGSVLDIGAADGDMGFLFQSLGCDVDFLDNAITNFNDCEGFRLTG